MQDLGAIDSLIVLNLEQIELAYDRVEGHIKDVLEREAGQIFRGVANKAGWHCKADSIEDDFWMAKPAWKMGKGIPDDEADYLLALALDCDSTKPDASWAGTFTGSLGSSLLLRLGTDKFTSSRWSRFLDEVDVRPVVHKLRGSGLRHDPNNRSEPFAVDVTSSPEMVSQAFEREMKFEDALGKLKLALESIVAMDTELDQLASLVRARRS